LRVETGVVSGMLVGMSGYAVAKQWRCHDSPQLLVRLARHSLAMMSPLQVGHVALPWLCWVGCIVVYCLWGNAMARLCRLRVTVGSVGGGGCVISVAAGPGFDASPTRAPLYPHRVLRLVVLVWLVAGSVALMLEMMLAEVWSPNCAVKGRAAGWAAGLWCLWHERWGRVCVCVVFLRRGRVLAACVCVLLRRCLFRRRILALEWRLACCGRRCVAFVSFGWRLSRLRIVGGRVRAARGVFGRWQEDGERLFCSCHVAGPGQGSLLG